MLNDIYFALKENPLIKEKVGDRIVFYEYPDTSDLNDGPFIIIDPLEPPRPDDYADNTWITEDQLFQIEVWSKDGEERDEIASQIQEILWKELGYPNVASGPSEYDKKAEVFRDARRYKGKQYVDSL